MVSSEKYRDISEADAVIFDCDGTIVDVHDSYQLTTKLTTCIILGEIFGVECELGEDFDSAASYLKLLGGFNNDWDKSSVMIQLLALHLKDLRKKSSNLGKVEVEKYLSPVSREKSSPPEIGKALEWLKKVISDNLGRFMTRRDLEKIFDLEAEKLGKLEFLEDLRRLLGPAERYGDGALTTLFDEIYLGEEGVREKYGAEPRYVEWEGAINREKIIIAEETLQELVELLPRGLAIVTGRGRWETEKTLGDLVNYFDLNASTFIADQREIGEKPDPTALIESIKRLGSRKTIYVGDSAEDLLFTKRAAERGVDASFAGVAGDEQMLGYFLENGADAVLDDVNNLPKLFEREAKLWKPF